MSQYSENNSVTAETNGEPVEQERQQILTFQDDGPKPRTGILLESAPDPCVNASGQDREHSIHDFLRRPYRIGTAVWGTGDSPGAQLFMYGLPEQFLALPQVLRKMQGFRFFRGTAVVRLQVNANPFQQGRLILAFVPGAQLMQAQPTALMHLSGITGYPHVDMDISKEQTVQLRIPFVAPPAHRDMLRQYGVMGRIYVFVYGSLTETDCDLTLWTHFEDVAVSIPTGIILSGLVGEASSESSLSDMAQAAGRITNVVRGIPNLNAVGDNASMMSTMLTDAVSLGFSKPRQHESTEPMQQQFVRDMSCANGVDMSKMLALDARIHVPVEKGIYGTDADEMSIKYITSKFTFLNSFTWDVNQGIDTQLWKVWVHPYSGLQRQGNYTCPTLVAYMANLFRYWRGTLKYKFKIVKTNFHSGRMFVAYSSGEGSGAASTLTPTEWDQMPRAVIDLRETSEFTIDVPFVDQTPWAFTNRYNDVNVDADSWENAGQKCGTGALYVKVVNTLRAPGSVSPTITILVEIAGGEDFELAVPIRPNGVPLSGVHFEELMKKTKRVRFSGVSPAAKSDKSGPSNYDLGRADEIISLLPAKDQSTSCGIVSTAVALGERCNSVRQLIKRPCFMKDNFITDIGISRVNPWGRIGELEGGNASIDYISYFSAIYSYMRGGVRVKIVPHNVTETDTITVWGMREFSKNDVYGFFTTYHSPEASHSLRGYPTQVYRPFLEGVCEFEAPFYCRNQMMYSSFELFDSGLQNEDPSSFAGYTVQFYSTGAYDVYRSGADDFTLGFSIGAPLIYFLGFPE